MLREIQLSLVTDEFEPKLCVVCDEKDENRCRAGSNADAQRQAQGCTLASGVDEPSGSQRQRIQNSVNQSSDDIEAVVGVTLSSNALNPGDDPLANCNLIETMNDRAG